MRILLTGGAGYIGSQVAHLLLDKGYKVTVIDSLITGNKKLIPKKALFIKTDISNKKKISKILQRNDYDAVMHFAGLVKVDESLKKPKKYYLYNYHKAKTFLDNCIQNNLKNIIFSSTAAVYGKSNKKKFKESFRTRPSNPYASSKLKLEKHLLSQIKNKRINCVILRYFNVAGADTKLRTGLIDKKSTHLIKVACEVATKKREVLIVNGKNYRTKDGSPIRDFIHVVDLANLHISVLKNLINKKKSSILNCGYGKGYTVLEIIKAFDKALKIRLPYRIGKRRSGDLEEVVANVEKIKKKFSWKPRFNDLNTIIKSAYYWEKKNKSNF